MKRAKCCYREFIEDDERHGKAQEAKTLLQPNNIVWRTYEDHECRLYGFSPECFSYLKDLNEESFVLLCKENYLAGLKLESERPREKKQILSTQVKTNPYASTLEANHLYFGNSSNELCQIITKNLGKHSSSGKIIQNADDSENLTKCFIPESTKSDASQSISTSRTQKSTSVGITGSATELENWPQKYVPVSTISDVSQNVSTSKSMLSSTVKVISTTLNPAGLENKSCSKREASIDNEKDNISYQSFTFPPKNCPSEAVTSENVDSKILVHCITQIENLFKMRENCLSHIFNSLCNFTDSLQPLCRHLQTMVNFLHTLSNLSGNYITEKLQICIFDIMCIASLLLLELGSFRRRILQHIQFWIISLAQIRKIHSKYTPLQSHGKPLVSFENLQDYEKALNSIWIFLDKEIDFAESMRLCFCKTEKDLVKFMHLFTKCLVIVGILKL